MFQRLLFLTIVAFFATMNVLLWRVEFGGASRFGSPVPVEVVLRRILTAPDDSSLEIRRDGERIGYCHWIAGAAEELVLETPEELEGLPEGMVKQPTSYALHVDGGILTGPIEQRLRFGLELSLGGELDWRELVLRLGTEPKLWALKASAVARTAEISYGAPGAGWQRQLTFDQLRDPRQLLLELGGPMAAVWLPILAQFQDPAGLSSDFSWEARTDWMMVGGTRVQVFRLEARLAERREVSVLVSRVGEIMRVDLPGGLSLVNEVLASF
ncbi:MAG: hypothetical protein KJ072_04760 [Verrucomicrobia bacterium]|nr:hypothetical protein [Verrucomicrobiota bacterium]